MLGLGISVQPSFDATWGHPGGMYERRLGPERARSMNPIRTLLDRGRKAGLRTAELYTALATRAPEAGDHTAGQADGNGFILEYQTDGRRVYRPAAHGQ